MCAACSRLESVSVRKPHYEEADISGLGKNYLLDRHLNRAIAGYRLAIRFYALRCLLQRARELVNAGRINAARYALDFPTSARWEHSRRLLRETCGITNVLDGLAELGTLARQVAECVEHSKAKDNERGRLVIPDYDDAHVPAGEDPVVRQVWSVADSLAQEATQVIGRLARRVKLTRSLRPRAGTQVQVG
jgi:hypothetical protein